MENATQRGKQSDNSIKIIEPNAKKSSFSKKNEGDSQMVNQIRATPHGSYSTLVHPPHLHPPYILAYPFQPTPYPISYQPQGSTYQSACSLIISKTIGYCYDSWYSDISPGYPLKIQKKKGHFTLSLSPYTEVFYSLMELKLIALELPP